MSEVKVNKISPRSGTTITLGDSGDTFTIPSGVTLSNAGTFTSFQSTGIDDNATSTAITIDSSENVGIGTTSTQGRLLVKTNTSGFTADASLISSGQISFSNSSGGTALPTILGRSDNNGGLQLMGATSNAPSVADLFFDIRENDNTDYATTTGYGFRFSRYGNELMRLTRDGKLGIGTSSPSHALQVSDKFGVDTSNSFGRIYLGRPVSPNLSSIMIQGTDVGEASNTLSMINYSGVGMSIELDSSASAMVFNVSGASTERMRIGNNGHVYINTNGNSVSSTQPGAEFVLDSAGSNAGKVSLTLGTPVTGADTLMSFVNGNGGVGTIVVSGTSTAYNTSSDYRLKENVSYDFDATTRLKQLKPARFNFIADADKTVDGFLAHEVSNIVPEAITGTKDEVKTYTDDDGNEQTRPVYQGIDQAKLVPLLVKTIQELEARITQLENA